MTTGAHPSVTAGTQWWPSGPPQIVIRAVDADDTYVSFRPLIPEQQLYVRRIPQAKLDALLHKLSEALPDALPHEVGPRQRANRGVSVHRALDGTLTDVEQERYISRCLGEALIHPAIWSMLDGSMGEFRLRITPSARLAKVPWELLLAPDGRHRLINLATLSYELPPTIHYRRPRLPTPQLVDPAIGPCRTIDPEVDPQTGLTRVLDSRGVAYLQEAIESGWQTEVSRADLGAALRQHPSRWLYVGHVTVPEPGVPGTAGLHLSDSRGLGLATFAGSGMTIGHMEHRALTTLDLLLGTQQAPWMKKTERLAADPGLPGHAVWPMPPKVALIACNSGADHTATEPLGLIAAAQFNGAEYVTSTRWALPTDEAFRQFAAQDILPTSRLVAAVDQAHETDLPVDSLRDWQVAQLAEWEAHGDLANCPLIFAALTTHDAPARGADGSPLDWPPDPGDDAAG